MAHSLLSECREEEITQGGATRDLDDFWPASVRLTLVRDECEELGMYLEGRSEGKRKWDEMAENKDHRPSKKNMGSCDMGAGECGSSTHLSPGWPVNELEIDLAGELSMNEAILSLPLASLKQEAPSPPGGLPLSPPRRAWPQQRRIQVQSEEMVVGCSEELQGPLVMRQPQSFSPPHSFSSSHHMVENKGNGLVNMGGSASPDFIASPRPAVASADSSFRDDLRFQYVLGAATSIATKTNEETLTYLNQGQPYEIKLKKLGDLSHYKGKILKSVVKICFHERRLQYMEKEQMAQWHSERPGERVVEVDVPLSYGLLRVLQPADRNALNSVDILWDPTKDAGVYIKVNCISTEFTAKKHGGEKGVPFRVQVETFLPTNEGDHRLHAAACQIKVFKLKGADRKHKQDREKVMRRPRSDYDKYQPGCESTVLTTLPSDAVLPPSLISTSRSPSPELIVSDSKASSAVVASPVSQPAVLTSTAQGKQLYCQDGELKPQSPFCVSDATEGATGGSLSSDAGHEVTQAWLASQRLPHHAATFSDFRGADLLRLSRDDLIQICGLADGIRLFNALHSKRIEPRLTIYVCSDASGVYTAVYLHACTAGELVAKLRQMMPRNESMNCGNEPVLVLGPGGARVYLTDDVVRHMQENATFRLQRLDSVLLLIPH